MSHLKKLTFLLSVFCWLPALSSATPTVLKLRVEGVINPIIGAYIEDGLKEAEKQKVDAVVIELDTPGGLLDATRTSISAMINSPLPVIVYVSPRGARATSAGLFITMGADIAAMAPETHIGAAHPVTIQGKAPEPSKKPEAKKDDEKEDKSEEKQTGSVMEEKMVSDASAYIRTLARERGRNAEWAEKAVRESVSLTAKEALEQNVIDVVSPSLPELIEDIDGRSFMKNDKELLLNLKNATIVNYDMSWSRNLLHKIAHPNVAYILMTVGVYGLIYELASPGLGIGGIVGVICLLLAFLSLQVLPINMVGLILIGIGLFLLVMDVLTPTSGILSTGGLIAFAIGSFLLIDVRPDIPYPRVSLSLIIPTVVTTGLFFLLAVRKIMETRRQRPSTGVVSMKGKTGEVRKKLSPEGQVFLDGELWTARSAKPLTKGTAVIVKKVEGNILIVEKKK